MTAGSFDVPLEDIPTAFEGVIPSPICTVGGDGMPNVTYLSVVHRLDESHVALSRQFFRKTDENTIVNPYAQISVMEPETGRMFQLDLVYERTETDGPLFEWMRTKLDAVAAHEGMTNVFQLRGTDVCRVEQCRMVPCDYPEPTIRRTVKLTQLQNMCARVAEAEDLEHLLETTLASCEELFGNGHAFVMLTDASGGRLYTVDSAGYPTSGAGSEVMVGEGLIGLAAARKQTVRVTHMSRDLGYSQAIRKAAERTTGASARERVIPLPSITSTQSQLVVPMLVARRLVGVICLESHETGAFSGEDESVVGILAAQVAMAISQLQPGQPTGAALAAAPGAGPAIQVKHYADDDSVFLDNEYLIKGVAGGILWRLLSQYQQEGREEFSNREIRLDQSLELPDIKDNLEARLILLRKRLDERCEAIRMEKTSRGRFKLVVSRPLSLVAMKGGGPL
jgi:adenylate cyclase